MPLLAKYKNELKIENASQIASILGHITPETKDAIEIVAKNADKLKIDDIDDFILAITPENKNCIELVADNAEKLEIRDFLSEYEHKKLLDKGMAQIKKMLE
ncbi:MAG: hypothetical protein PHV68_00105 [Candidatus Gastranaerophilales bacterium]|nr:hypothetical protein [Candidatus Gastranaerophilales bacterium]